MGTLETAALPRELAIAEMMTGPDTVARYAALTADFNPIHLDPDFAAKTSFGHPIVHGTLGLNLVIEAIERTFGGVPERLALDTRFIRPLPVGSSIRAGGVLREGAAGTYDIFVETMAGERAVEGTCTVIPAAEHCSKGRDA
ncbi:MaoC/PaaZ C-terminal domain-containing protein [Bosea sp. RAF48]|uniref:MaoC/PaaZ C-terminal domain-containing protein n=1 Tax=Bosea sp. RAF48 TaxID=3237480 RepID=UPI003F91D80A